MSEETDRPPESTSPLPTAETAARVAGAAPRKWYTKKRFVIPAAVLALFIAIGIGNSGANDDQQLAGTDSADSASEAEPAPAETKSAAEKAAEEAEAEAKAAEAEAAAEAAAEEAAAEEAAKAEAERVAAEQAAAEAAAAEAAKGTVAQQNASRTAQSYLDYTSFSRTGLIGQLEFEGYSTEDATWAVDRLTVDWNAQAALKAKEYLDYTAFSRSGLIDQLLFEGFTPEQAEYGVSTTGL